MVTIVKEPKPDEIKRQVFHCKPGDIIEVDDTLYLYPINSDRYIKNNVVDYHHTCLVNLLTGNLCELNNNCLCSLVKNLKISYNAKDVIDHTGDN